MPKRMPLLEDPRGLTRGCFGASTFADRGLCSSPPNSHQSWTRSGQSTCTSNPVQYKIDQADHWEARGQPYKSQPQSRHQICDSAQLAVVHAFGNGCYRTWTTAVAQVMRFEPVPCELHVCAHQCGAGPLKDMSSSSHPRNTRSPAFSQSAAYLACHVRLPTLIWLRTERRGCVAPRKVGFCSSPSLLPTREFSCLDRLG